MRHPDSEMTFGELVALPREELNKKWEEVKEELQEKEELTDDEKNYLLLAIFYTTKRENE